MSPVTNNVSRGYIVPGMPHPLLAADTNPGYASIRHHMEAIRREIDESDADLLVLYSTQWLSVIGHQIQAHPKPSWRHVDPEWHELGEMPYEFRMDTEFAAAINRQRNFAAYTHARLPMTASPSTRVALWR